MDDFVSTNDLFNLLIAGRGAEDEELLPDNINYVLYARKSTLSKDRQEKSIEDQIADCFERAIKPNGIRIDQVDIIREQGSAKEPEIRPLFTKMINDIKSGKYGGIVTWHPDRLARNMKEAGEIIDLLDKRIIKDIKFATAAFDNTPTGKMLLGISFVLSKQYSEHLSESILRGNRRHVEGRARFLRHILHGYYIADDDKVYPDGQNFLVIKKIFEMRKDGVSQPDIVDYLKAQEYYTVTRRGGIPKTVVWHKNKVSLILSNPVYAGVLVHGKNTIDLVESYDFIPAVSVKDFLSINNTKDFRSNKFHAAQRVVKNKTNFLNRMIICWHCGKTMTVSVTTKKDGNYLRYRCETVDCAYHGSGPRAQILLDFAINWLDLHRFNTKENYQNYVKEIKQHGKERAKALVDLMRNKKNSIAITKKKYEDTKQVIAADNSLAKHYVDDLSKYELQLIKLEAEYVEYVEEKDGMNSAILTYENYLKLFDNTANLLRSTKDVKTMDELIRKFYSNFVVRGVPVPPNNKINRWEVVDFKLKEPYEGFLKSGLFQEMHSWSG